MSILVIGSLAFDDIETDHGSVNDSPGGSALYCSMASSFFSPVSLLGVVGEDFPADEIESLQHHGINTDNLHIIPGGRTFRWGGRYETDMNKRSTTNLELNVFQDFNPILTSDLAASEFVFLGNIDPDLQLSVLDQLTEPKLIGMDTIEHYINEKPESLKKVLSRVDLVLINDDEARQITGEFNIITAAHLLLEMGPTYVVIKKGEHGSILASNEGLFVVPAFPLKTVTDPTGAGDSYAGATLGYLAKCGTFTLQTLRQAVVYGGVVASFTVEDFGLQRLKDLTTQDIDARVTLFREITEF